MLYIILYNKSKQNYMTYIILISTQENKNQWNLRFLKVQNVLMESR